MQLPFQPETPILLASYPTSGPELSPQGCPTAGLSPRKGCLRGSKSGLSLSSSLYSCVLPNCWIDPLILCCSLVPTGTWNFCSLKFLVCRHPGLPHTSCHPASGWQLNSKFSGQVGLEKAYLNDYSIFFFRTHQAFNMFAFRKVNISVFLNIFVEGTLVLQVS